MTNTEAHRAAAEAHEAAAAAHANAAAEIDFADPEEDEDEDEEAIAAMIADHRIAAARHESAAKAHRANRAPRTGTIADIETHGTIGDSSDGEAAIEATAKALAATEAAA